MSDIEINTPLGWNIRLTDDNVFLFYKSYAKQRWFCAVTKNANDSGFLITAYQTSAIKTGEIIWQK